MERYLSSTAGSVSWWGVHMHVHANTTHTETTGSESVEETPRLEHVQHNHMKLEQIQLQLSEERDSGRGRTTDYRRRVTKKRISLLKERE